MSTNTNTEVELESVEIANEHISVGDTVTSGDDSGTVEKLVRHNGGDIDYSDEMVVRGDDGKTHTWTVPTFGAMIEDGTVSVE